jgi:SPP1 family predicted phage head-tail adaptor
MRSGMFNKYVTIQRKTYTRSSLGEETLTWTNEDSVWVSIRPIGSTRREFLAMQQVQSDVTHMVTMRFRYGITPDKRILYNHRILTIQNVIDPGERHETIVCYCKEELV